MTSNSCSDIILSEHEFDIFCSYERMIHMSKKRLVIANRRRFFVFLIGLIVVSNLIVFGFFMPDNTSADLEVPPELVTVRSGDTLWSIAGQFVSEDEDIRSQISKIKRLNRLESSTLQIGQQLLIPLD